MRIFGIDPGSERTGYGCVETDGRVARLVTCGAITALAKDPFPQRLARIHRELSALIADCAPDCVAIESLFSAVNARTALKLGHARGVAMLAAVECGCAGGRIHACRRQARGGRLRPRRETPGAADDQAAARLDETALAARRRRRAGRRDLSSAFGAAEPARSRPHDHGGTTTWAGFSRLRIRFALAGLPSSRQRMIAFLRGRILDKQPNLLIVDVQGVGYHVNVPLSTFYDVGEAGAEVSLLHRYARPRRCAAVFGFSPRSSSRSSNG